MILALRNRLWGTRNQQNVSGSGATTQSRETNSGNCRWYSALTHKIVYLGTTIKKLVDAGEEVFLIPSIEGDGGTEQAKQFSDGFAHLEFEGSAATIGARCITHGRAYAINPVLGNGATSQEAGWSTAHAEHVDVELQVLAAILAAV